jgi:hypothetical protein
VILLFFARFLPEVTPLLDLSRSFLVEPASGQTPGALATGAFKLRGLAGNARGAERTRWCSDFANYPVRSARPNSGRSGGGLPKPVGQNDGFLDREKVPDTMEGRTIVR